MDITRVPEVEKEARVRIGKALKNIRQDNGQTLEQGATMVGNSPELLMKIEHGGKSINIVRFLQHVATFGGKVYVESSNGKRYDISAQPFTEEQKRIRMEQRAESIRYNEEINAIQ